MESHLLANSLIGNRKQINILDQPRIFSIPPDLRPASCNIEEIDDNLEEDGMILAIYFSSDIASLITATALQLLAPPDVLEWGQPQKLS